MSFKGQFNLKRDGFVLETGEFKLPEKGLTAIFGHSGSGKTTFLRCLAGLETTMVGEIFFNDQAWLLEGKHHPVHKRQLGYVFQEASLFTHLSVLANLRYGLKRRHENQGGDSSIRIEQVVEWLGIEALLERDVNTLSGGERQRVAIGRTLLSQPKVLLMDEPMASLDVFSKRSIMPYLERLRDELKIPIIYVTHSPDEVERLADHVLFMAKGRVTHFEAIEEALNRADTPLYRDSEPRAVLSAVVVSQDTEDGLTELKVGEVPLWLPALPNSVGETVRVVVSAQQISLMAVVPQQSSMLNHLPVTIDAIEGLNDYSVLIRLRVANEPWPLLAQVNKRSAKALNLKVDQAWVAAIKSVAILN